jgi:hypothetical protein
MTDKEFAERAALILHNMALENMGWRGWFRRWYMSDEPLRNDAANLLIASGWQFMRPVTTRYVGETNQ